MLSLQPGHKYYRADVKELAGLSRNAQGGPWDTGIVEHDGEFLIFANIGISGRTGDDYDNRLEDGLLHWYHKRRSRITWPSVRRLLEPMKVIHVFWRTSGRDPFEYAGQATPVRVFEETSPVEVLWSFAHPLLEAEMFVGPDEIPSSGYPEGNLHRITVNKYERDRSARQACIDQYGLNCVVCDLNFEGRYGSVGTGYIHVHHLIPISEVGDDYRVKPIEDLRPMCPNCHAMIHRRNPPLSIEELRKQLRD